MAFNMFRKILRSVEHHGRVLKVCYTGQILEPSRIVNRALYGTDYHPDEVAFKLLSAMSYCGILQGEARDEPMKAYDQSLMQGFGILEHKWDDNGRVNISCTPRGEHIKCEPRYYNAAMMCANRSPVSLYPG